jgi:hypothetical protein
MKFWAYLHESGHIHLKRYWGKETQSAIDDAFDSTFVVDVCDPFEASSRDEAVKIASQKLSDKLSNSPIQFD